MRRTISVTCASLVVVLLLSAAAQEHRTALRPDETAVLRTIEQQVQRLWDLNEDDHWNMPTHLGSLFLSEWYFFAKALNYTHRTRFNATIFTQRLLDTQEQDGSWRQVHDANLNTGWLDATVVNYWYLKEIGFNTDTEPLRKARTWILEHGGIEKCQMMTKFKLALFGQIPWESIWYIPLFLFKRHGFVYQYTHIQQHVAQWVYPHLMPLAYMRFTKLQLLLTADLHELWADGAPDYASFRGTYTYTDDNDADLLNVVHEMFAMQQPLGSFGGYTVSTYLSLAALRHYASLHPGAIDDRLADTEHRAIAYIDMQKLNAFCAYNGTLDDGRWWDTLLASWALAEAEGASERLARAVRVMQDRAVQRNGGIAYGLDFEYAPDADDTALLVTVLGAFGKRYERQIGASVAFMRAIQNSDGGFPAFTHEINENNLLLRAGARLTRIDNSAEIFDPSCADITGHVLEALGAVGARADAMIAPAIQYLKNTQWEFGSWRARWGINFIYSIGAVIPGLARVGYDLAEEWVTRSIEWLIAKQNADGGFGEGTQSYLDAHQYAGVGQSTVTQTAWALLALLEVDQSDRVAGSVFRAVNFLLAEFQKSNNRFWDSSVVGTGHRGVLYLQYPSYAETFPLLALSRYRNLYVRGVRDRKNDYYSDSDAQTQKRVNGHHEL